jgi:hypothetical protein
MPVSHKHNAIFVHIPKTGGTTVFEKLGIEKNNASLYGIFKDGESYKLTGTPCSILQHLNILQIKKLVGKNCFDNYFKFAFVRDPYTKAVSTYFYQKAMDNEHILFKRDMSFGDFVENLYDNFHLLYNNKIISHNGACHFLPQSDFIFDKKGGLLADYIGRFENFEFHLCYICYILDIHWDIDDGTDILNKGIYDHASNFYDVKTKKLVHSMYKTDFENFNYKK